MEWVDAAFNAIDFEFVEFLQTRYYWPEDYGGDECLVEDETFRKLDFLLDYECAVQNYATTLRYRTTFVPSNETSSILNTSPGVAP